MASEDAVIPELDGMSIGHGLIQIRRDLDDLAKRARDISDFQSEIDSALERIIAIERYLGI